MLLPLLKIKRQKLFLVYFQVRQQTSTTKNVFLSYQNKQVLFFPKNVFSFLISVALLHVILEMNQPFHNNGQKSNKDKPLLKNFGINVMQRFLSKTIENTMAPKGAVVFFCLSETSQHKKNKSKLIVWACFGDYEKEKFQDSLYYKLTGLILS